MGQIGFKLVIVQPFLVSFSGMKSWNFEQRVMSVMLASWWYSNVYIFTLPPVTLVSMGKVGSK